jgi:histidinol-phosphate aminotransferase
MGYDPISSQANFLLFDAKEPARELYDRLLRKGVIVRPVGNYGLPTHLRVSVGLKEENAFFLNALKDCKTV